MAYISQDQKKAKAPAMKALCAKYGVKGSLSISNHTGLVLTITEGKLDFISQANTNNQKLAEMRGDKPYTIKGDYEINLYHFADAYTGDVLEFIKQAVAILNDGNHDRSDSQSDYFDVGWYSYIRIGKWDKPYSLKS